VFSTHTRPPKSGLLKKPPELKTQQWRKMHLTLKHYRTRQFIESFVFLHKQRWKRNEWKMLSFVPWYLQVHGTIVYGVWISFFLLSTARFLLLLFLPSYLLINVPPSWILISTLPPGARTFYNFRAWVSQDFVFALSKIVYQLSKTLASCLTCFVCVIASRPD